ncbi:MAG: EamA family transporter [Proteobacteria bacterium]|nr:EamA family transporter [Pseudomonadota bacterium]
MNVSALLFTACTLIWGSTWVVITWQLGVVPPEVSVVWRFGAAGLILMAWCVLRRERLRFDAATHGILFTQGALMFSANYLCVYWAEQRVVSGLVAVAFATLTFMLIVLQRVMFGRPITRRMLAGTVLGVVGVALLFLPELLAVQGSRTTALGIAFALVGTLFAALGQLAARRAQRQQVTAVASSTWAMLYGSLVSALVAWVLGVHWTFDPSPRYVLSLAYLVLAGTIAAFLCYLELMRRIGVTRSSYTGVAIPVIALLLSALFEDYHFGWHSVAGAALAAAGNLLVLRAPAKA